MIPAIVGVLSLPTIKDGYGTAGWGLLSLIIYVLLSAVMFDFGVGLGTTKFVSMALKQRDGQSIPDLLGAALTIAFTVGSVVGLALAAISPFLGTWLNVPQAYQDQVVPICIALGATIPVVTVGAIFRSLLEAAQRFDLMNLVKVPTSTILILIPLVGVFAGWSLITVTILFAVARVLALGSYAALAVSVYDGLRPRWNNLNANARKLLGFGGWVSVSNILNPVVTHAEKLIIPSFISITLLGFYTAAYEIVSRIASLPFAIAVAVFPRFSQDQASEFDVSENSLVQRMLRLLIVMYVPVVAGFIYLGNAFLTWYFDAETALYATSALQLLAVAFFFNSLAYIFLSAVQGLGRPDLKAKWDMVSVPLTIGLGIGGVVLFGLDGAAASKMIVTFLDCTLLLLFLGSILKKQPSDIIPAKTLALLVVACGVFIAGFFIDGTILFRVVALAVASILPAALYYFLWGNSDILALARDISLPFRSSITAED